MHRTVIVVVPYRKINCVSCDVLCTQPGSLRVARICTTTVLVMYNYHIFSIRIKQLVFFLRLRCQVTMVAFAQKKARLADNSSVVYSTAAVEQS